MNRYFAYVRVSSMKQQTEGVSLQEQRDAITEFALRNHFAVVEWFEETESAARQGRKIFKEMLHRLQKKQADGLLVHKVDRGARNLRDWADIGDLIDQGISVRFAHDDLRLDSRGGRLAADIQAVIAADYIRNMKEEIRKGVLGRLKQGLYPLPAPLGYINRGKGRTKLLDPRTAPYLRSAFERYATGTYTLTRLSEEMRAEGIRNQRGNPITIDDLSRMLRNPFYVGIIQIRATGLTFPGIHQPLIDRPMFDEIQRHLRRIRIGPRRRLPPFKYSRQIKCACGRFLVGERHKGRYVYYRCHGCVGTSVREEVLISRHLHIEQDSIERK